MGNRKRYFLSFDMDNPRHREAEALYCGQAARQRTEFVVSSILEANRTELLEQTVRQAIREELKNVQLPAKTENPESDIHLNDLPDSLVHALEDL
ncbi:MAG: plasmid segregation centromere-binding protein ParR [Oscillospiraceae bacterium]|nr:plasmid segregation centromere-binding protein ParR [Oscillospiraceae bacterium]